MVVVVPSPVVLAETAPVVPLLVPGSTVVEPVVLVLVLVGSLVVPPIVAVALPAVVSVAEALTEVVGTLVAAVSVGSPLLTVVGWLVPSLAEPVVEPVSGLQAASRGAAVVRRAGRWRASRPPPV